MHLETIEYGDWQAVINLSRGGNCIRLYHRAHHADILRVPDYERPHNPYLYGMPILFPANRISGGHFDFEGRTYRFPINEPGTNCALHGSLHERKFSLVEKEADSLECSYRASRKHPYPGYPQSFEVRIRYRLSEEGLYQHVTIQNHSRENMPVMLGFHTTFRVPFIQGTRIENVKIFAQVGREYLRDPDTFLPTGILTEPDEDTRALLRGEFVADHPVSKHFRAAKAGLMTIEDTRAGCKIIYRNDEKLSFRLVYGSGQGFVCMEPQSCLVNAPNSHLPMTELGLLTIAPGTEMTFCSSILLVSEE